MNTMLQQWIRARMKERTSWDGAGLVLMGLLALFAANLAKIAGGVAVVYGVWTIWKKEH